MVQLLHAVTVVILFLGLSVNAQFEVFRGDEALRNLTLLSDPEKLAIAAKTGETHVLELHQEVQAAVVQEGVSLNIDCLPWLSQVDPDLDEYMIRWTFIQLDEFGNVEGPDQPPQELFRNDNVSLPQRVIVGGEFDRWLNISQTIIIQGAEDPDSRIYMCQVCRNITTHEDCSTSNYTQLTVGSSPIVVDSSVIQCVSRNANDKVVNLDCEIMNDPQPSPRRTWYKDGQQVYSAISGFTPDPSEFVMMNPILMPGVLDPITFSTLSDGSIVYNYEVENITSPQLLPPGTTTEEEAEQQVFELLLGNWTCMVSNTLGSATITYLITDCAPQFNITTGDITVNEDAGEVEVCVTSDISVTREIIVAAETQSKEGAIAQATAGLDYAITAFELTFTPEDASTTQCAKVIIIDDEDPEPLEQFSVKLLSASPEGTFVQDTSCISINDNDVIDDAAGGNISFERETYTVSEDDGYVEVCIVSFNLTGMIEVEITSADVKEVDYPAFEIDDFIHDVGTVLFDTSTSNRACVNITISNDIVYEGEEQFLVLFGNLPNAEAGVGLIKQACVTIEDDDIPEFIINPTNLFIFENAGVVEVCVSSEFLSERNVIVTAETGPKVGAVNQATADSDYESLAFNLTFMPMDETPQVYCRNITIIDDLLNEVQEQFTVTLTNAFPDGIFREDTICISIIDNDPPQFTITPTNVAVSENIGEVELMVSSVSALTQETVVTVMTQLKDGAPNQATADVDYESSTYMLTFPPSEGDQTMAITVRIINDTITEDFEEFIVKLVSASPEGTFIQDTSSISILDDEIAPEPPSGPRFTITPTNITVNESDGVVQVCVRTEAPLSSAITVIGQTEQKVEATAQAIPGVDYMTSTFPLFFQPSLSIGTLCATVGIIDDDIPEQVEQFSVKLIEALPEGTFIEDTSCISIIDDDPPSVPQFFIVPREIVVNESVGEVEVCVRSDIPVSTETLVVGETGPKDGAVNQATPGADYMSSGLMWRFLPSVDVLIQCRRVGIINDSIEEPTEEFSVKLTNVSPEGTIVNDTSCISILDNDLPKFMITPGNIVVNESVGEVELCVTSDIPVSTETFVVGETQPKDGSVNQATAGTDYMSSQFMLRFLPSDVIQTECTKVGIIDDSIFEGTEQFSVKLVSSSPDRDFTQDSSCVSIVDDDDDPVTAPQFTITPTNVAVSENIGEVELMVSSVSALTQETVVTVMTQLKDGAPNQATADVDYESSTYMLTFPPSEGNQTMAITVRIINDTITEDLEEFIVKLVSASPEGTFIQDTSSISIFDDDETPQFTITPTNVAVSENIGEVELMVSSVSALTQESVVTVMTQLKDGAPNQATGTCTDTTTAVVITFVVTTVIMLIVGVVFSSLATFFIMKKRKSTPEHHSPTDGASGGPFYEEVSPSNATSKEEVEMDKNVAYGHVQQ